MITKTWSYKNVNQKGILKSGGSAELKKGIYSSILNSCDIESCKCVKELWATINFGYNKKRKSISGITFYFDSLIEFEGFLKNIKRFTC